MIDTTSGDQHDVLATNDRSLRNPRLSPDRQWLAFDAIRPGEAPSVMLARLNASALIPETDWIIVDRSGSHPFWSADGHLLYYVAGSHPMIRTTVVARRFSSEAGAPTGEPVAAYSSTEIVMPAFLPGTAPLATPDQILLVLGDYRGDIWMMDLNAGER